MKNAKKLRFGNIDIAGIPLHPIVKMRYGRILCGNLSLKTGINLVICRSHDGAALSQAISGGPFIGSEKFTCDDENILRKSYNVCFDEFLKRNRHTVISHYIKDHGAEFVSDYWKKHELPENILKLNFVQSWHYKYFVSSLIGISKGCRLLCFPPIDGTELGIQSFRLGLLSELCAENDIFVIVPVPEIRPDVRDAMGYKCRITDLS